MDMFDLTGEKAIVTGGGQGIGKEMALALAEAGADVAVVQRRVKVAEKTAEEIRNLGRDAIALSVDVSKSADVNNMIKVVKEKFGKIDILFNNAGVGETVPVINMTEEQWDRMMNIHLKGTFLCSQAAAREMIKENKGSIVNISSICGFVVAHPQHSTHYSTAKAAIAHFTKGMAVEWAKYNIRVNAIAPGYIRTDMVEPSFETKRGERWLSLTPMGRFGEPHEIKGLALFLASRASSYVTGSVILMDGGYTCW